MWIQLTYINTETKLALCIYAICLLKIHPGIWSKCFLCTSILPIFPLMRTQCCMWWYQWPYGWGCRLYLGFMRTYRLEYVYTVYPKKYAHGFVVLCFVVVMQSFIMNSHEVFIHIHQGCFAGTGTIVRLPQCQWSKPDGYGKISQCITTTKHSKAKTVCIFLGMYCIR